MKILSKVDGIIVGIGGSIERVALLLERKIGDVEPDRFIGYVIAAVCVFATVVIVWLLATGR